MVFAFLPSLHISVSWSGWGMTIGSGPVHLAYNPSYSASFFSQNSIFLLKKTVNSVFQPAYNSSQTAPVTNASFLIKYYNYHKCFLTRFLTNLLCDVTVSKFEAVLFSIGSLFKLE
jgi:hypothetical protein